MKDVSGSRKEDRGEIKQIPPHPEILTHSTPLRAGYCPGGYRIGRLSNCLKQFKK